MSAILPIKIETSIEPSFLRYDWKISRKSRIPTQPVTENHQYKEHILLSATNQSLSGSGMTQSHALNTVAGDTLTTLYVSEIRVYLASQRNPNYAAIFSGIYTLEEIQNGKIHLEDDAPCFKTTSGTSSQTPNHTVSCQISREKRAFFCNSILTEEAYYQGHSHPNDPFAKAEIASQITQRLRRPYPEQGLTSLCGPAAFYYCLLKDRPDIYKQVAWSLWKYGKVKMNGLTIKPKYDCRHPDQIIGLVSGLDWLTLASLRDSSNAFRDYDEVSDKIPGITLPSGLVDWFNKVGSSKLYDCTSLLTSRKLTELVKLNQYYANNQHVAVFIAAKILGADTVNTKDHWVVLANKIKVNGQEINESSPMDGIITTKFFTWGTLEEFNYQTILKEFLNHFYGGLVFTPVI